MAPASARWLRIWTEQLKQNFIWIVTIKLVRHVDQDSSAAAAAGATNSKCKVCQKC